MSRNKEYDCDYCCTHRAVASKVKETKKERLYIYFVGASTSVISHTEEQQLLDLATFAQMHELAKIFSST
jgi:hypothetical protein